MAVAEKRYRGDGLGASTQLAGGRLPDQHRERLLGNLINLVSHTRRGPQGVSGIGHQRSSGAMVLSRSEGTRCPLR
jgi:hypothetical protein